MLHEPGGVELERVMASNAAGDDAGALSVDRLTRVYGSGPTLVRGIDRISLAVAPGEVVCIMGKSGSGKSTLLRLLGLIDVPTSGTITIEGTDVTALDEKGRAQLRLSKLGYIFQEYALLPELTAEENVLLPALMLGRPRQNARSRARGLLEQLDLVDRGRHRPAELSGGEQQRVAIARALVNEPVLLFADEPTGNLDSESTNTVMEALLKMNRELGVTIVFVSHDPDHGRYADMIVHLRDGRLVEQAS
jgi:putative ABC transport system ATP-binding protein